MYAARRSGLKKEMFGYLPGGYGRMLERFGKTLGDEDVELCVDHAVRAVEPQDGRITVRFANDRPPQPGAAGYSAGRGQLRVP